jgi:hypothetical protein
MRAGDPEPRVDEVLVLAEAMRLYRFLEGCRRVVVALLRVVDAAEVREGVEEVVGVLLDVVEDAPVVLLGVREVAAIEIDRAAEQERVAEEVRIEEGLVGIEELQRFLKQMQRVVRLAEGVGIQRSSSVNNEATPDAAASPSRNRAPRAKGGRA